MTSTGLSPRAATALAYSGWWVTGALIWAVERDDRFVRFHAAQALVAFGSLAVLITLFASLALVSLSFLPAMFGVFAAAAALAWVAGVVLWGIALWKALRGEEWRIPVAAEVADRMATASAAVSP